MKEGLEDAADVGSTFARLFDEARAVLEELKDETCDPTNPADACAFGALQMYRYLTDDDDGAERETARILGLFALAASKGEASKA